MGQEALMVLCMMISVPSISCVNEERTAIMEQIPKEYLCLFNAISDAEVTLRTLLAELMSAQQRADKLFLEQEEPRSDPPAQV